VKKERFLGVSNQVKGRAQGVENLYTISPEQGHCNGKGRQVRKKTPTLGRGEGWKKKRGYVGGGLSLGRKQSLVKKSQKGVGVKKKRGLNGEHNLSW